MEERNMDLGTTLGRAEWEALARVAREGGPDEGYFWREEERDEITVHFRPENVPSRWSDQVAGRDERGDSTPEVARFHYNGGEPVARLHPPAPPQAPGTVEQEQEAMRQELEAWVRGRWHALVRDSGVKDMAAGTEG